MSLPVTQNEMEVVNLPVIHLKMTPRMSVGSEKGIQETDSLASYNFKEYDQFSTSSSPSMPLSVPPTTPAAGFSFCNLIESIDRPFPKLTDVKLPYIREVGIKTSIDILSNYFFCSDYKFNAVQFWFLDVITDCLWKLQDEFQFPERYQKIIVGWILHVFDLIRDPQKNLSRKEFFQIFNEALAIADEKVQTGCEMLPEPDDLFTWVQEEKPEEEISFPSDSGQSSNVSLTAGGESYVALGIDESTEIFKIPMAQTKCHKHDISSGVNTTDSWAESLCGCEESIEFYQPDRNTPDRFRSSSTTTTSSSGESDELPILGQSKYLWKRSYLSSENIKKTGSHDQVVNSQEVISKDSKEVEPQEAIVDEWNDYMDDRKQLIQDTEMKILINNCALFAIKQFVYDYFHDTFQYTIIKLALINKFTTITQNINKEWKIPKILKEELEKPKEKKEKKPKKEKKEKKSEKKAKEKKKPKKDKKKKESKKNKKSKKAEKPKTKKPTKEEKAELARLKREQEKLEEEKRKSEENKRLLFPLGDATNDEFFKSIFEHWVRPTQNKKKGGGNKKKK